MTAALPPVLLHEASGPAAGEYYYLHAALYSITGLTDAAGAPVLRYTYDAYGLPTVVGDAGPGLPPFGDADGDGDIDLADFAAFQVCYSGSGVPYGPGCDIFDADLDGDVDEHDLRVFLVLLDGRADFDHDLDIDADDWTLFAACLAGPGVPLSADGTGDGWVDAADFVLWADCATAPGVPASGPCAWSDLDGDGDADLADYARLTLEVGLGLQPACRPADLDADGDVDLADAALFQAVFTGPRGGSGAAPANPYLFTGRRLDFDLRDEDGSVTGQPGRPLLVLYDYRARQYDPFHGRFCQRDPALYAESLNLYQYALNNPQGRLDPSGQFSKIETVGVSGLIGALFGALGSVLTGGDVLQGAQVGAAGGLGGGLAFVSGAGIIASGVVGGAFSGAAGSALEDPLIGESGELERLATDIIAGAIVGGATAGTVKGIASTLSRLFRGQATYVIGKVRDLQALGRNEAKLPLPDQGSPAANWAQNSSVLRAIMRSGRPIRDASLNPDGTLRIDNPSSFLEAERNLLRNQGWQFDPSTGLWSPAQ